MFSGEILSPHEEKAPTRDRTPRVRKKVVIAQPDLIVTLHYVFLWRKIREFRIVFGMQFTHYSDDKQIFEGHFRDDFTYLFQPSITRESNAGRTVVPMPFSRQILSSSRQNSSCTGKLWLRCVSHVWRAPILPARSMASSSEKCE